VRAPPCNALSVVPSGSMEGDGWFGPHGRSRPRDAAAEKGPRLTLDERLFTRLAGDERLDSDPPETVKSLLHQRPPLRYT